MKIDAIVDGIVIDHITAGNGMKIYRILGLEELNCPVAIIQKALSHSMGTKDIIKVDADVKIDMTALGYINPDVTVNIIKDSKIVEKYHPGLPLELVNIVKCKNPRCITTTEQELPHIFKLTDKAKRVYRCIYCEAKAEK